MKVLCPVDFSETSVRAAIWLTKFLDNSGGGNVHLAHFIFLNKRSTILLSLDDLFHEKAKADMYKVILELEKNSNNVSFTHSIHFLHPKEGIIHIAKKDNYDLIVTGTTGLTALKDIVAGSVTQYIFDHSPIPVLAIPSSYEYRGIKKIAIAVDDLILQKVQALNTITTLCKISNAKLELIHVTEREESLMEYDPTFDLYFKEIDYNYKRLVYGESLLGTINKYCRENEIDLLGMIHHKTNWFKSLFIKSSTKSALFKLHIPLLVLNEV